MKNIVKRYSFYVMAGLLLGTTASCDSFLDLAPLDNRTSDNFYKTEADATEALTGVYDVLQWNTVEGFHPTPMLLDVASDDAYAGGANRTDVVNIQEIDYHRILPTNPEVRGLWRKHFIGISRANTLLSKMEGITASDDFKKRTIAEAKFLRAHFYLDLVRFYENVPLRLTPPANPTEYNMAQATPKEVYDQIAKDLEEAIVDLPAVNLATSRGHATKWAAKALLARAYLFYKGVYGQEMQAGSTTVNGARVYGHLTDIINTSGHDLLQNYNDIFKRANEFSIESVWEISYSDENPWWDWGYIQGGDGNMQPQMQGPRIKNTATEEYLAGWGVATPTQDLYEAFAAIDPRRDATILAESDLEGGRENLTIGFQHTGYFSKKYTTAKEYAPAGGQLELNWGNNYRAIRFADVLLMAAELALTNGGNAQTYLTRVRARVGLPAVPATLDNIFKERRLELALEGHRYWDLLRRGVTVADQEISTTAIGPLYVGDNADFAVDFNTARKGFFPIPQSTRAPDALAA
ncbi:MAG: RagB/SusD family nutrient uptake outer membrane protein, partial [Rufibacter sp.]